jgi:hypothetical protein
MRNKLPTNVFWGEHRISELLAMNIKSQLENSLEIIDAKIPFIEYTEYKWHDYIELLYRQKESEEKGISSEQFNEIIRTQKRPEQEKYDKQLRQQYGSVSFNLHDGVKIYGYKTPDIAFWIPETIQEDEELSDRLIDLGKKHNLEIETRIYRKDPKKMINFGSPNSIIVECYQPSPEETMHYPTAELEELARKYSPASQGVWYHNQVAKTEHPLFVETVKKYSDYLKDAILETKKLGLTQYDGELPRLK